MPRLIAVTLALLSAAATLALAAVVPALGAGNVTTAGYGNLRDD